MPIDLTKVYGNINTIKRDLFYDRELVLKFMNLNDVLLPVERGFYFRKNPTSNLAIGAEYWECAIADDQDDLDLENIIPLTTHIVLGTEKFKISQYFRPRGLTKQWKFRLESIGEHE